MTNIIDDGGLSTRRACSEVLDDRSGFDRFTSMNTTCCMASSKAPHALAALPSGHKFRTDKAVTGQVDAFE